MMKKDDPQSVSADLPKLNKPGIARVNSKQLFASANELIIQHNGEDYRLRITSNGKLILTK